MLAFDSDLAPIFGQQITLAHDSPADVDTRVDLLIERYEAPFIPLFLGGEVTECDLVVRGVVAGSSLGARYLGGGQFQAGDGSIVSEEVVRGFADEPGQELTFTCYPPGSGVRAGVDRDLDGVLDALDNCPAVPNTDQVNSDSDGVGDTCDNCILVDNDIQRDSDADGFGNLCDADLSNDGIINFVDLGAMKAQFFGSDPDADLNGDGVVNFIDLGLMKASFFGQPGPSCVADPGTLSDSGHTRRKPAGQSQDGLTLWGR